MKKSSLVLALVGSICLLHACGGSTTPPRPVATHLAVLAGSSAVTAGTAVSVTASAVSASGDVVTSYSGTVHFASTDAQAVLPGDTALVGGSVTLQVTLNSPGTQTVTVSDVANGLAAGTSPSITVSAAVLAIASGNPPDGVAGGIYNLTNCDAVGCGGFPLAATGGVPPYTWSWTAQAGSSTPPGLSIASAGHCPTTYAFSYWRIACVPTTAGTYKVVITVADSASPPSQVSNNYTINITNPPPPVINTTPPPSQGAINLPYSFKFAATGGLAPLSWSETTALPPGLNLASDGTLSGTPTATGSFPITIIVEDAISRSAPPQDFTIAVAEHGFKVTGSMSVPRVYHTATTLSDGKMFVVGGRNRTTNCPNRVSVTTYPSTETYDPATRSFSSTGNMTAPRELHTSTLLKSGKVLIAGGYDGAAYLATAEIFDPLTNTFTPTGNMTTARKRHQATLLTSGKVLLTGGWTSGGTALASAEIFDPDSLTFTRTTGDMHGSRALHTQTTLKDGTVLVAGGDGDAGTAEVYDPGADGFSAPIKMTEPRAAHAATLLNSGKVLITGGNSGTAFLASAELFDPSSRTFAGTASMATARDFHTATLLNDGTVLVAGGGNGQSIALSELFDTAAETFMGTGSLVTSRSSHTATLLNDGSVLVTGGAHITGLCPSANDFPRSAETYQ